jgi:uncharacterized OB-fold protein
VTLLKPQLPRGSTPVPSRFSLPYWEGCALGELRIIRCQDCGQAIVDAPRICWRCHGRDLRWEVATGGATLYSWTIVWRPQTPDFEVPYAVAIVTLDESVELVSSVVGCEPGDLVEGMTLTVEFHPISTEMKLPYFRPARS